VIYGTGGFARETAQLLTDLDPSSFQLRGFLDDDSTHHGQTCWGLPILGDVAWLATRPGTAVVIAVGSPQVKQTIAKRVREAGATFPILVHPSARIGHGVTLGEGCIICGNCFLTTDIVLGTFVTLNLGCTVGHDTAIADFVTCAPACNLSGNVRLETGVELGTNTSLIPNTSVGAWSIVGAGACVTRDIPPGVLAVGTPAKPIRDLAD